MNSGREYHTMTLRALYDYVITSIVSTGKNMPQKRPGDETCETHSPGSLRRTRQVSVSTINQDTPDILPPNTSMINSLTSIPETNALKHNTPTDPPITPALDKKQQSARQQLVKEQSVRQQSVRSIWTKENEGGVQGPQVVTIRERLGGYLHPRDMRRLVTPFSPSNECELMVRRHVMLLNFDPLRAIVLRDRLLVLVPDGADSILIALEKRVRGGINEIENQIFGDDDPSSHISQIVNPLTHELEYVPTTLVEGLGMVEEREKCVDRSNAGRHDENKMIEDDSNISLDYENQDGSESDLSEDKNDEDGNGSGNEVEGEEDGNEDGEGDCERDDDDDSTTTLYSEYGREMDDEWEEFEGKDWIEMTFELQSVDAVLASVIKMLADDSLHLRKKIFDVMEELRGDKTSSVPGDHVQEQLRILKDRVREMEGRVQGFVRAMNLILDDEEDMALMNLSRLISNPERFIQPVSQDVLNEESDEPELILEVYLQQALSEVNALVLLKGNILNTEELVSLQMDTIRNRLLYINTVVSAVSLSVTCAGLVGSFLGMNLTNKMESDPHTFVEVVVGTLVGALILMITILVLISRTGVMPVNPHKVLYSRRRVDVDVAQANLSNQWANN